jgi:hypothetical protein
LSDGADDPIADKLGESPAKPGGGTDTSGNAIDTFDEGTDAFGGDAEIHGEGGSRLG